MQVEVNQCSSKQSTKEPVAIMNNTGMNIGINLSIFCILAIFLFILYVPLELLFYATKRHPNNYSGANGNSHLGEATTAIKTSDELASQVVEKNVNVDYQNLKICEKLEFEGSVKSIYTSNQDQNCSYLKKQPSKKKAEKKEQPKESIVTCTPPPDISERKILPEFSYGDVRRITNSDSISVTTNIIATLLIISAIAALVEVLRIRFSNDEVFQSSIFSPKHILNYYYYREFLEYTLVYSI